MAGEGNYTRLKYYLAGFATGILAMGVAIVAIGFMISFFGAF
jgi:hypothetical protein